MIVSINQPAYLPWLGYFDRIAQSDIHIILDHVQFEKNSNINRNKIRTLNSWSWLTVPIKTKSRYGNLSINNLEIDNSYLWKKKHLRSIEQNYSKTSFFLEYINFFEKVYMKDWFQLAPLIYEINSYIMNTLNIKTKIIKSSDLKPASKKSDLILELCKIVDAKKYISGPFGREYLDEKSFDREGIKIDYHEYIHPTYTQHNNDFIPNMSVIDLLFNEGNDSLNILRS